jgi:hypothetical protein
MFFGVDFPDSGWLRAGTHAGTAIETVNHQHCSPMHIKKVPRTPSLIPSPMT